MTKESVFGPAETKCKQGKNKRSEGMRIQFWIQLSPLAKALRKKLFGFEMCFAGHLVL